jgi:hypothetical protein
MRKITEMTIYWGDEFGKPPKTPKEKARDEALAKEILQCVEQMRKVKIVEVSAERPFYRIRVEVGSEAFNFIMETLQQSPHLTSPFRVWKDYTRQELESAELLIWGPTNQAIEEDYYDFYRKCDKEGIGPYSRDCPTCRARLEQIRDLMVNKTLMKGKDISLTYSFEVILSEWVARLFQEEGLTGFELRPVHHYKKPYKGEPALYQLVVTNVLPPMASPPTEFDPIHHYDDCGRTSRYLKHVHWWGKIQYYEDTDVYYPRGVLEVVKDFNHTAEYFGDLAVSHPYVIITQRVYRLLREHRVKNWEAVPVYLVD